MLLILKGTTASRVERFSIPVKEFGIPTHTHKCHFYCFAYFGFIPGSQETQARQTVQMTSHDVNASSETGNALRPCT